MKQRTAWAAVVWLAAALASAQSAAPPPGTALPEQTVPAAASQAATPAPGPAVTPVPAAPPLRLEDPPVIPVETLPSDNPFGAAVEAQALAPVKPAAAKAVTPSAIFVAIRVDPKGKVVAARRARDPIPSLSAGEQKSYGRWTFEPGRKAGQPVESWAALRLDLAVEIDSPKIEQITLTPVTPATPIPTPVEWGTDAAWLDAVKPAAVSDGTVPNEQLDTPPVPKKTPWDADSFEGPFSVRFWVKVGVNGRVEKAVPIQASDPLLIGYFRRVIDSWLFRPARAAGAAAATWNDLSLGGKIEYSIDIKQIASLRRSL